MHRHFGQGEFQSDETSFDSTAFPPSTLGCSAAAGCKYVEFGRAALWFLRQDPETWPRNETRFGDDLRRGLITVLRELSTRVTLSVKSGEVKQAAIQFDGSQVIETFPQQPPIATDPSGLNGTKSSLFQMIVQTTMSGIMDANVTAYALPLNVSEHYLRGTEGAVCQIHPRRLPLRDVCTRR